MSLHDAFFSKCSEDELKLLKSYTEILVKEMEPAGLIGPADTATAWKRHIDDSLLPLLSPKLSGLLDKANLVSDLGTGAGLPGIPLAIKYPKTQFQLVDASIKRVEMLEKLVSRLGLKNIMVSCCSLGSDTFKGKKSDVVLFRAFRKPLAAMELALYVSKIPATILYWRIQNPFSKTGAEERLRELGIRFEGAHHWQEFAQPAGIYYFSRKEKAGKGFPRSFGRIQKDPLVGSVT